LADPYPIGGTIRDIDGNKIADNTTTVIAIDITKSTSNNRVSTSCVTDPTDGSYALDLANLVDKDETSIDYSNEDRIQIVAYDADDRYYACERHTVDTGSAAPVIDIYLHSGPSHLGRVRYLGGFASNANSSATYFHIYDMEKDALIARIDIGANTTVSLPTSIIGTEIKGGMCIVYDGDGTNAYTSFVRSVK